MNVEKNKRKIQTQNNVIARQLEQIESLKLQIENLNLEIEEKDKIINSFDSLRQELINNVEDIKKYKEEYSNLINELKNMKEVMNQTCFRGRWKIIKFLIK